MIKMIPILTIILLLVTPVPVFAHQPYTVLSNQKIVLRDPTTIPHNLDELFALIQNGGPGWDKFLDCSKTGMTGFYIQWSMVQLIENYSLDDHGKSQLILPAAGLAEIVAPGGITFPSKGTLKISENSLFTLLIHEAMNGNVQLCKQKGDLTVYGPGVQDLFNQLTPYVK
jgi:hypothetical protein